LLCLSAAADKGPNLFSYLKTTDTAVYFVDQPAPNKMPKTRFFESLRK